MRKTMIATAALALSFAAVGVCKLNTKTAFAAGEPAVSMMPGASVRIGNMTTDTGNGMRFTMQMDKKAYESMMTNPLYTDVQFGVIIAPDTAAYQDISYATVFAEETKKYDWATWDNAKGEWVYEGTDSDDYTQIMLYSFDKMYSSANAWESEDNVYVRGTISKIQAETREFQGIGYVTYKYDGVAGNVFLKPELRSMTQVAQLAVLDGDPNAEWLTTQYIADYMKGGANATTTSVQEEYYFEQEDGTYKLDESKTQTVTQYKGQNVYVHDEVTATRPTFDGYVFNPTHKDSVTTGVATVNGKLVLKRHYQMLNPSKIEGSFANVIADNSNNKDNWYNSPNPAYDVDISEWTGGAVTDKVGVTYTPATEFSLVGQNNGALVGPLFGLYSGVTKSDLQKLKTEGYDLLTFSVKLNYTAGYPRLRILDFAKMRELKAAGTAINKAVISQVLPASGEKDINQKWETVFYSLSDLIEFYDDLFVETTTVPLAQLYLYQASVGANPYSYYITDFSLVKNADLSPFTVFGNTYAGLNDNPVNGLSAITGTAYTGDAIADREGTEMRPHIVYDMPADASGTKIKVLQLRSANSVMSKFALQSLQKAGKTKFVFYVNRTVEQAVHFGLQRYTPKTAELSAYYTENAAAPDFTKNFSAYMQSETVSSGANKWVKFEYSLDDMITLFDVFFTKASASSFPLARFGCAQQRGGPVYITGFSVE